MKPRRDKTSYSFETPQQVAAVVNPTVKQVIELRRKLGNRTVKGWTERLTQWLSWLERGNWHDNRSPLFEGETYAKIASDALSLVRRSIAKFRTWLGSEEFVKDLYQVEEHQAELIGGRGLYKPAHLWMDDAVQEVWDPKIYGKNTDFAALERSLDWLESLCPAGTIRVPEDAWIEGYKDADTNYATDKTLNTDTNSCFATYVKHWYVHPSNRDTADPIKIQTSDVVRLEAKQVWDYLGKVEDYRQSELVFVATASQRTNVASGHAPKEDGSNVYKGVILSKHRVVMAMPKTDTVCGKPYLNRLLEAVREIRNPDGSFIFASLFHPMLIDKSINVMLSTAEKHNLIPLCTDFDHFDASVNPDLALKCMERVSKWFHPSARRRFMNLIYTEFYRTVAITPTKIFEIAPSSVKSGGITTNFVDTCVNIVSQRYGYESGTYKKIYAQCGNGDDACLVAEGATPDNFVKVITPLGLKGNASKQYYRKGSIAFCQKIYFHNLPGGIYPVCRTVASTCSSEDDVPMENLGGANFKFVSAYRTVSRLDNACFNPAFVSLVEWYKRIDPVQLGSNMPASKLAALAGSYAQRLEREKFLKPWKAGTRQKFSERPVNRVLRGDFPPTDAYARYKWVYGFSYDEVQLSKAWYDEHVVVKRRLQP